MTMTLPTVTLPTLTEEEVQRCFPRDDDAGFGALTGDRGPLPLKAMDIRARIDGLLVAVELSQTFVNTHREAIEATYIFPLPDRAAVTRFRMEVGGRVIEGVLKERGQARREYDVAITQGHRAAIAEEERPGVFTMRVGNVMPGETARVSLHLTGPLVYDSGEATFRFPLVVAPRYVPGTPLGGEDVGAGVAEDTDAVPDASRISPPVLLPGYPNPVRLSLAVDIEPSALMPHDFRSSLHTILIGDDGMGRRTIRLEPGERLNRDFVLRFRVGDEQVRASLALVPDGQGAREGTFVLTLVPPAGVPRSLKPRDVVFVLDRSGSMAGWKMVAARRALARMVDTLTERDRFNVYAFDNALETAPELGGTALVPATDRMRFRVVEFLAKVDARGGTEMAAPLDFAVKQLRGGPAERDKILVLVTDGQVGNEDQILKALGKKLDGLRVFTLGVDQAVNEGFLRRLAVLGGGFCEVVESEDRLDEVMRRLHSRLAAPVLGGLNLSASGIELTQDTVVPGRLPDLFPGAALQVMGRYRGAPEGVVKLDAEDASGRRWTETIASRYSDNGSLTKAWARAYLREQEDRFAAGAGDLAGLERRIVEASLRYGVMCRFTSFVAVDRSATVNEGGEVRQIVQAVETPAGWAAPTPGAPAPTMMRMRPMSLSSIRGSRAKVRREVQMESLPGIPPATAIPQDAFQAAFDGMDDTMCCLPESAGTTETDWDVEEQERRGTSAKKRKKARSDSAPPKPAPPSSPVAGPPSTFRKIVNAVFGKKQEAPAEEGKPAEPVDLTAYRRRAAELAKMAADALALPAGERLGELGTLAIRLRDLLQDLRSVGVASATIRPLEQLEALLRGLLDDEKSPPAEVEKLLKTSQEVLGQFASGA